MFVTFVFVNVILNVKYHFGANDLAINAVTIGGTLFTMITATAAISGGCLNPAIGIVQQVFQSIIVKNYTLSFSPIAGVHASNEAMVYYIFGPLAGGALAGIWQTYNGIVVEKMKAYENDSTPVRNSKIQSNDNNQKLIEMNQ